MSELKLQIEKKLERIHISEFGKKIYMRHLPELIDILYNTIRSTDGQTGRQSETSVTLSNFVEEGYKNDMLYTSSICM